MTPLEMTLSIAGLLLPAGGAAIVTLIKVGRMLAVVDEVHAQVHPNGGRSLRDAVIRIEASQNQVSADLREHTSLPAAVAHGGV